MSINNSNDTIRNQTRDLPACSAVPQPTAPLRAPIIIIIVIIILSISFMQGIYTYVPETNHVPREHRVATILM
jgi:hypothetical protein